MKRANKAGKIRAYIAKNPLAKAKEIAEHFKVSLQAVYQVTYKMRKEAAPKTTTPTAVDTVTQITPERMKELVHQHTRPKHRMQSATPRDIVSTHHTDMVNHPPHYKAGGIETIDFIEAKELGYNLGNVVKYITRADHKGNKLEDLKKAQWYLNRAIEQANT